MRDVGVHDHGDGDRFERSISKRLARQLLEPAYIHLFHVKKIRRVQETSM